MKKSDLVKAIQQARKNSRKRNFKQSFDIIISFRDLNLKNANEQVDTFVRLPHDTGKAKKICCVIGPELKQQKEVCDLAVEIEEVERYDKKKLKKVSKEYDYFISQANFMPQVAKTLGKYLGPQNKMPNPKAGCVVNAQSNLTTLKTNLQKTIHVAVKTIPLFQARIGSEESKDEELIDNMMAIYNSILHALPKELHNIKNVYVKTTMGSAVKVGAKEEAPKKEKQVEEKKTEEKVEAEVKA